MKTATPDSAALEHPLDGPAPAIVGAAGTGKTTALVNRAIRAAAEGAVWLTAPDWRAVARLRERIATVETAHPIVARSLPDYALDIIKALAPEREVALISDLRAAQIFEDVGARLFSLDWTEFVSAEIDPEITGLRAPERFSSAAFRLIRRLRGAQISPDEFRVLAIKGATEFYGRPPNFADSALLMATGPKYRDSLRVSALDLRRQHEREIDLVKILHKLYTEYVHSLVERGCLTDNDALYEATLLLRAKGGSPFVAPRYAFVDDAQDLIDGEIELLRALYGSQLERVTLAGDEREATRTFSGARGAALLAGIATKIALTDDRRGNGAIREVAARLLPRANGAPASAPAAAAGAIETFRAADPDDESRYVAAKIVRLCSQGVAPGSIAVIARSLRTAFGTIGALLARNVPVDVAGAASLFEFAPVQDALAPLWALADPYRHDWLLRNLEAPWLALSDASIGRLCAPPADPQAPLFEVDEATDDERAARWNRERDLRLARNVTRGDVDAELAPEARERLQAFRAALLRWENWERTSSLPELATAILSETVFAVAGDDARGRFERGLAGRLLDGIAAFAAREPLASLEDFLTYAERVADADADLLFVNGRDPAAVAVLDVEAAKGREFDHVFVLDARAGAFPRYYAPDAFLFLSRYGMVPKDDVGPGARAARTAKFTYAMYRYKLRERYNDQERRAFYCAATRARRKLYVSASGRPTKGNAAPELLAELSAALGA